MRRLFLLLSGLFLLAPAQEVQQHGLVFEQWVSDTFFEGYRSAGYTQRWDIPAAANRRHGGVPVNPKFTKHGTAVDLGDALRQHAIDEAFLLVIGFWRQEGGHKRIVNLLAPEISPERWRRLWGPVTREDLLQFDRLIKDSPLPLKELRREALRIKRGPPFNQAVIQLNPKIGSDGQRRLQCSIRFRDIFVHLAPGADPAPQTRPALWGEEFPGPIASPPRTRRRTGRRGTRPAGPAPCRPLAPFSFYPSAISAPSAGLRSFSGASSGGMCTW